MSSAEISQYILWWYRRAQWLQIKTKNKDNHNATVQHCYWATIYCSGVLELYNGTEERHSGPLRQCRGTGWWGRGTLRWCKGTLCWNSGILIKQLGTLADTQVQNRKTGHWWIGEHYEWAIKHYNRTMEDGTVEHGDVTVTAWWTRTILYDRILWQQMSFMMEHRGTEE